MERKHESALIGRLEALSRYPWLEDALWKAADARFPVRLPRAYLGDSQDPADPRLKTALPDSRELEPDFEDRLDPVGDARMSPLPWVVQKHPDRVLLMLTKRCHLYCRYCFRRDHRPGEGDDPSSEEWDAMLEFARNSGAEEVILSGGDPLAIRDEKLFAAIDTIQPDVPVVRIHTRAPITWPIRITDSLVSGLKKRQPLWVMVHSNHPLELTEPVREALQKLVDAGIPVLNQAVLLSGINDDPEVLARLCQELVRLRIKPYYLHHPDHAPGNAAFRISLERGLQLWKELRKRVSGLALPQYVLDQPDGQGKIPVEEWLNQQGKVVEY
jgi:lysine 2,3-aminomutase